jgi:hypothetical protein
MLRRSSARRSVHSLLGPVFKAVVDGQLIVDTLDNPTETRASIGLFSDTMLDSERYISTRCDAARSKCIQCSRWELISCPETK